MTRYLLCLLAMTVLAFVVQEFSPRWPLLWNAELLIVHALFCAIAIATPFPVMLAFALITGFLWDARYQIPLEASTALASSVAQNELPFGFAVFSFGLSGLILQGLRPTFREQSIVLPVVFISVVTALSLFAEYCVLRFHRGSWFFSLGIAWQILLSSLFCSLISPVFLLCLSRLAKRFRYRIRLDGWSEYEAIQKRRDEISASAANAG